VDIHAIHLQCDTLTAQQAKHKVSRLYGSTANSFPDGTKMRLTPTINNLISQASKEKYGLVEARQEAFMAKLCSGNSWEFSQNLLLDYKGNEGTSLREAIMSIPSSKIPGCPVFHAVDPAWGTDNGINFNFLPENKAEARMYIAGLAVCIRDTLGESALSPFMAEAVERHVDSVFNSESRQIFSTMDIWVHNLLVLDNEFNFMETATEKRQAEEVQVDVEEIPTIYRDTDLVSTFCSRASGTSTRQANEHSTEQQDRTNPKGKEPNARPTVIDGTSYLPTVIEGGNSGSIITNSVTIYVPQYRYSTLFLSSASARALSLF
jgi:hypothetical protein